MVRIEMMWRLYYRIYFTEFAKIRTYSNLVFIAATDVQELGMKCGLFIGKLQRRID